MDDNIQNNNRAINALYSKKKCKRKIVSTLTFLGGCFAATYI